MSPDGALVAAGGWTRATQADFQEQICLFNRATGSLVKRIEGIGNIPKYTKIEPTVAHFTASLGQRERSTSAV